MIYLDSAATSLQKPPEVARAVGRAVNQLASPGRGGHPPASQAGEVAFRCREAAAELFHLENPEDVVFTMNATHGLNIAIRSLVGEGDKVVISPWEHNAVTRTLHAIPGVEVVVAEAPLFDRLGTISAFSSAMTADVKAVIFTSMSNVFGFVLPVQEIGALCRQRRIPFILDASQSAGNQPLDAAALGAAHIAMPGHKGLFGPQGTGLLLCGQYPAPLMMGGTGSDSLRQSMPDYLPDRLEAGTHNMAGVAGLLEGIRYVNRTTPKKINSHECALLRRLSRGLSQMEGVTQFVSPEGLHQGGVLSLVVEGRDCEGLGEALGERGICVRAGLHCAPLAHRYGGTLETGTLRISLSPFNTAHEIDRFLAVFSKLVEEE